MKEHKLTGNEFCDFKEVDPLPDIPPIANFEFKTKKDFDPIVGSGIYSIYYDSMLLYIGKYRGIKKEGPFSGSVTDRWYKHIALLTGRSKRMCFPKRKDSSVFDEIKDWKKDYKLKDIILKCETKVMKKDRGHNYSFRKFKFSAENWDDFKNLDVKTLKRFTCIYSQYIASDFDTSDFTAIRNIVGRVEGTIIDELQPRCNKQGVTKPRDNGMEESMKVIREEMKKAIKF